MPYQEYRNQNQPMERAPAVQSRPRPVPQVYNPPGYPVPYPAPTANQSPWERLLSTKVRKKMMTLVVSGIILFANDIFDLGVDRATIAYFVGIAATFILGQGIADMGKERAVIQAQTGTADHVSYEVEVEDGASANFASGGGAQRMPSPQRMPMDHRGGQVANG